MAKLSRSATARIASTINARYYPSDGVVDAYYLDGRITGRRESRAADVTLDREDRGFFLSVFAHPEETAGDAFDSKWRHSLDQLANQVKTGPQEIDTEINDLADCAIEVGGRTMLQEEGVRTPYFAGLIIKEAEFAAVTTGSGCAYLYRGDVLYPLTKDDYPLEAIDYNDNPVERMDAYVAGIAGSIRYSNIAQLEQNDCLIVCNREVMEAIGQRDMLRLLYEAEDQADAAGMIITAAAAKMPGIPLQCMLSFVEYIVPAERTGRLNLKGFTGVTPTVGAAAAARQQPVDAAADRAFRKPEDEFSDPDRLGDTPRYRPDTPAPERKSLTGPTIQPLDDADYPRLEKGSWRDKTEPRGRLRSEPFGNARYGTQQVDFSHYDDYVDADEYNQYEDEDQFHTDGRTRRIILYAVLGAIILICLFALYKMLFDKGGKPGKTTAGRTTAAGALTPGASKPGGSVKVTASPTPVPPSPTPVPQQTHIVKRGDSVWSLAQRYYGSPSNANRKLIIDANNIDPETELIIDGRSLIIPPKPEATPTTTAGAAASTTAAP